MIRGLSDSDVKALREVVRFVRAKRSAIELALIKPHGTQSLASSTSHVRLVQAPEGGIPPRDGQNPGTAACSIMKWKITGDGNYRLFVTSDTITCHNWAATVIMDSGERLGFAYRLTQSIDYSELSQSLQSKPLWVIIAEDCTDDATTPVIPGAGTTGGTGPAASIQQPPDQTPTAHDPFYSLQLQATGTDPLRYDIYTGSLPSGLSLDDTTGLVSGEVTSAATSQVRFMVTDGNGASAVTPNVKFDPHVAPIEVNGPTSTLLTVGVPYSDAIVATYGLQPYTYTVDTLPSGLSLDKDSGSITGTPDTSGTVDSTFVIYDAYGQSATHPTTFTVAV